MDKILSIIYSNSFISQESKPNSNEAKKSPVRVQSMLKFPQVTYFD